jgi:UDP-N-acetylmuramoylalanine-D-glutamate ligase
MIVVYGKGKVGNGLHALLTHVDIDHVLMDDADRDDVALKQSTHIIISPGIKPSHDVYTLYWKKVLSELSYLGPLLKTLALPKITFIGITWTNGKSTTSWIMYQALQKLLPSSQIWLTWNFDVPLSQTLLSIMKDTKKKEHICVVETSSFMLYNIKDFVFDYAIWLNIARDHLDRHGTMEDYTLTKMAICVNAKESFIEQSLVHLLPTWIKGSVTVIPQLDDISYTKFLWKHNMYNIAAVISCIQKNFSRERYTVRYKIDFFFYRTTSSPYTDCCHYRWRAYCWWWY